MASRVGGKIKLTTVDELLCVPSTEGTTDLDVKAIYPFENHPFKVLDDEKMEELVESILINGVLTPILVRPDDEGTYEMISGHRRLHAAIRAGLSKIPAIVKEMTDDEATIAMVDANVQREEVFPSEKAFAFKMKMDAMKRQGARTDLTLSQNETKLRADEVLAQEVGTSRAQVQRYIRLTNLISKLLDMVDDKRMTMSIALELSFLTKEIQQWVHEYIHENGMIKSEQVAQLHQFRENENVTKEEILQALINNKPKSACRKKITITEKKLNQYFPDDYSQSKIEEVIVGLLEQWKQEQKGR